MIIIKEGRKEVIKMKELLERLENTKINDTKRIQEILEEIKKLGGE